MDDGHREVFANNKVIAICGDSGSGKTTLSNFFAEKLGGTILECDRYHRWERNDYHWKYFTPLNPQANEIDRMISDVEALKYNKDIHRREYDHTTGKFTEPKHIEPSETIIVTGLHSVLVNADVKIFIDTEENLKYLWKINRDFKERGYNIETIMEKIRERQAEFNNYILPQKKKADIIIEHKWNSKVVTSVSIVNHSEYIYKIREVLNEQIQPY